MASTLSFRRSDSADKTGSSDPETMDGTLDLESGTVHEMNKPVPGMWRFPTNPDLCCIYRVPNCLRQVNPEAYTLQMVLIGPLHHSLKSLALNYRGDITNAKSMEYLNTEEHKKIYLAEFTKRVEGKKTIDGFRRMIEEDEGMIRASYSESTAWIQSPEFVEIILHDSVFIIEFMLRATETGPEKIGDPIIDEHCLFNTIMIDLILLENLLPYFILAKLFDPISSILRDQTFHGITITCFHFEDGSVNKFKHFTDLNRCVRVQTVPDHDVGKDTTMYHMYNADKLSNGGVKFKLVEDELSVLVTFDKGVLKIPRFMADDHTEIKIRNIMALEQCHYPYCAHVCNYITFLDALIDSKKDVDLLVEKEIICNCIGHDGAEAKMVNKLCLGVTSTDYTYYSGIASQVKSHYTSKFNESCSILKRVYFSNHWRGTATVAATFLLLLSLIQTMTSIILVLQKELVSP